MLPKIININFFIPLILAIYSFIINWFSGNIGVMPMDTFAFFDTGFSILKDKLPIRDFWIFTGLTVDYIQSLFFFYLDCLGKVIFFMHQFLILLEH